MATSGSFILAIVRLVLHVMAAVVAVLTLPYLAWSARHGGRRRVDSWIVLCIAAGWSIVLNLYEAIRQGLTGIGSQNPRLLRPSPGHCIGAHMVTLIVLLAGLIALVLSQWGRESPLPRPPTDEDQLEEEDNKLMVMTLIAGSLAWRVSPIYTYNTENVRVLGN
ncbi:hypothetical protein QBC37DRAFT_400509 [Rhypophila decipiens]|uniref:Uncharacterized protein n=1 Tax=Rhypophila decipiens TaxID=261697 RepID=A0AAN6Y6B4_9PEZI|nr:hypothetical protein QBC37DRAFT_400509 [Rhypophila decipiens]